MKYDIQKSNQAAVRAAFFDSGKPLALWRGRSAKMTDRKKEASKKACRKGKIYD